MFFQNNKFRIEGFFEGRPISIWEMRNPMIFNRYADIICRYNFSEQTAKRINEILPLSKDNLFLGMVIKKWGPTLKSMIPDFKDAITASISSGSIKNVDEANKNISVIDLVDSTFLFENYQSHFQDMIPVPDCDNDCATFPIVLAHNDAQENNILMNLANNRDLVVIDYEYAGWNPMAMDLANYLNETMLDNAYPSKNGIAFYKENCMSFEELEEMTTSYM